MTLLALELNDADLVLARAGEAGAVVAGSDPGFAVLNDGQLLTGAAAAARSRIAPLYTNNRYWQQLATTPLPWGAAGAHTVADLAHAQLTALLAPVRNEASGLLLAVPPGYSREQLGLLAGIANEAGVPVRGLVDLALAACSEQRAQHLLHLDVHLHETVLTVLEHSRADGALRRIRFEILPGSGWAVLQQRLIDQVATTFVRRTRFDPLHDSRSEQRLFDLLPQWLADLTTHEEIEAQLASSSHVHTVSLGREACIAALDDTLADLLRLVQAARPAGLAVQLCVSARAAAVPGLLDRLATLRDCTVVTLPSGAAACGALQRADAIVRKDQSLALVHRLPLTAPVPAASSAPAPLRVVAPELVPTHVLYDGRSWAINDQPLVLGTAAGSAARGLPLPAGTPGLSRSHCTLVALAGQARLEDHSTYGTFVNDECVRGQLALQVGDVLRLGTPGVSLQLIRVMTDHGAP